MAKNRQSKSLPMTPGGVQSPKGRKVSVPKNRPGEGSSRGDQKVFEDSLAAEHMRERKRTDAEIRSIRKKAGLSPE